MSRRSRRRREVITVLSALPSPTLTSLLGTSPPTRDGDVSPSLWRQVEDRRQYHPLDEWAPPKMFTGNPARIVHKNKFSRPHKSAGFVVSGVPKLTAFKAPQRTLVCVRRSARKEVLFALRKTKKGAGSRRRLNRFSEVSCSDR